MNHFLPAYILISLSLIGAHFINVANGTTSAPPGEECTADIAILVDQSSSITRYQYNTFIVPFLKSIINGFDISEDQTHLAMVRFCNPADTEIIFDFTFPQVESVVFDEIDKTYGCAGTTALEKALNLTYSLVFSGDHGARPISSNVSRIAIIVTDGMATDATGPNHTIPTVQMLINDKSVAMFAVGEGKDVTIPYLKQLTGRNDMQNVFDVDKFQNLDTIVNDIIKTLIRSCIEQQHSTTERIPTSPSPDWAKYCTRMPRIRNPTLSLAPNTLPPTTHIDIYLPSNQIRKDRLMDQSDQNLTALLLLLSQEEITSNTADRVSETLESLLLDLGAVMNEEDIYLTALILYRISIVYPLSDLAFSTSVQCVNVILTQDEGTVRRSNFLYESTQLIEQFFYQSTAHTNSDIIIEDRSEWVFFSIQHVRCGPPSQKMVGAVQFSDGEVCILGPAPVPADENGIIVFIELSTDAFCDTQSTRQKRSATNNEFRVGSGFYRNQKLFGKEDPEARNSTPSMCDLQSVPKSDFVTIMDVMPVDQVYEGPMPHLTAIKKPVSFGMNTRNGADYKMLLHAHDKCSYWNNSLGWISDGCKQANLLEDKQVQGCQCDHLTDFTLIISIREADPMLCDPSISIFSWILGILSMTALFFAIILYFLKYYYTLLPGRLQNTPLIQCLDNWRREDGNNGRERTPILEWLMCNMFLFLLLFLLFSDQRTVNTTKMGCNISAAVLYCILLSSFLWTAFAAINTYRIYNKSLNFFVSKKIIFPAACGLPVLITVIIWFAKNEFYARNDGFCWIRPNEINVIPGVVLPTSIFVFLDAILTFVIVDKLACQHNEPHAGRIRKYFQYFIASLGLQFIMVVPWVAQYFTVGSTSLIAVHYVFTFFNGTQGFWLGSFYVSAWVISVMSSRRAVLDGQQPVQQGGSQDSMSDGIEDGEYSYNADRSNKTSDRSLISSKTPRD